jgi:membrane-bound metal-dependent hydrolase YbcI (DUF457 family)
MASYKAHIAGGLAAYGLLATGMVHLFSWRLKWKESLLLLSVMIAAALFPDVDTNGKARKWFCGAFLFLDAALILNRNHRWAALLGLLALVPLLSRHRGWTHSFWAMFLVPSPILIAPYFLFEGSPRLFLPYYLGALLGYASHLLMDRRFL